MCNSAITRNQRIRSPLRKIFGAYFAPAKTSDNHPSRQIYVTQLLECLVGFCSEFHLAPGVELRSTSWLVENTINQFWRYNTFEWFYKINFGCEWNMSKSSFWHKFVGYRENGTLRPNWHIVHVRPKVVGLIQIRFQRQITVSPSTILSNRI